MKFIGIDPGRSGAIAVIDEDGGVASCSVFSEEEYKRIAFCSLPAYAMVEDVHAMPKQGLSSTFSFGVNKGWILGVMYAVGVKVELVSPNKWKKWFGITSDKSSSIAKAKMLFPNVSLRRTERCTKDHDGMAEALLLAEYARSRHNTTGIPYQ